MIERAFLALCLSFPVAGALLVHPAVAQGNIPQPVIEECNSEASAASLPECLKEGAVAFEMLNLAATDGLYGNAAGPVIEACREQNDTFQTTWVCFRVAAEKAAETAELIGRENISDRCVAGISDPDTLDRLTSDWRAARQERFPDERYSGGTMYSPFKGCDDEKDSASPKPTGSSTSSGTDDSGETLTAETCSAYALLEEKIALSSEDELRAFAAAMKNQDEDSEPSEIDAIADLPAGTTETIIGEDEDQSMTTLVLVGAFLRQHHPGLLNEFLASTQDATDGPGAELGQDIAEGLFSMMLDEAHEAYAEGCPTSGS